MTVGVRPLTKIGPCVRGRTLEAIEIPEALVRPGAAEDVHPTRGNQSAGAAPCLGGTAPRPRSWIQPIQGGSGSMPRRPPGSVPTMGRLACEPPHTSISDPVNTAAWCRRRNGALMRLVADHASAVTS